MNLVFRLLALAGLLSASLGLLPAEAIAQSRDTNPGPRATPASPSSQSKSQTTNRVEGKNSVKAPAKTQVNTPARKAAAPRPSGSKSGPGKANARAAVPAQALPALKRPTAQVLPLDEPAEDASDVSLVAQTLRSGCAHEGQPVAEWLAGAGVNDPQWIALVEHHHRDLLQSSDPSCLPFTLSLGEAGQVTSMAWLRRRPEATGTELISLTRPAQGERLDLKIEPLPESLIDHHKVDVALDQILGERGQGLAGALPPALERQVQGLARAFQERHQLSPASLVRIVYSNPPGASVSATGENRARLLGMRFFDARQVVDFGSAVWIDREDLPGGFFTTAGVNAERIFWSSPIETARISRGVGSFAYARTVRKTVRAGDKTVRVAQRVSGWRHHQGVDFAAPTGTPIHAVADGTVLMAAFYGGYGNLVILEHGGGYTTYYAHLSAYGSGIQAGSKVRRGDEIGRVGSTGRSTGPHLHFEIRKDNVYIDPLAPQRHLDLWVLRERDQPALARRNLLMSAITQRPATISDRPAGISERPAPTADLPGAMISGPGAQTPTPVDSASVLTAAQ